MLFHGCGKHPKMQNKVDYSNSTSKPILCQKRDRHGAVARVNLQISFLGKEQQKQKGRIGERFLSKKTIVRKAHVSHTVLPSLLQVLLKGKRYIRTPQLHISTAKS